MSEKINPNKKLLAQIYITAMAKTKNTSRHLGHLFKRGTHGEYLSASSTEPGVFWLETVDAETRKKHKQRLTDESGEPIRTEAEARLAQKRIRAPFLLGERAATIRALLAELDYCGKEMQSAQEAAQTGLTLSDAWKAYESAPNRHENGEETRKHYLSAWNAFLRWCENRKPRPRFMAEINEITACEYGAHLAKQKLTANTYNKHIGFLRLMFDVLAKRAHIQNNPFGELKRKTQKPNSRRPLSPDEVRKVLTTATGEMHLLFLLGICTGLRLGDCATLRWSEVDLIQGIIRRIPNKTRNSSGAEVLIGIPGILLDALKHAINGSEYVLPDIAGVYMGDPKQSTLNRKIRGVFKRSGIEVTGRASDGREFTQVGFHSLRHTWVSLHAAAGTPQALIQQAAGHSNPAMTEHYTHVAVNDAKRIAEAINIAIDSEPSEQMP